MHMLKKFGLAATLLVAATGFATAQDVEAGRERVVEGQVSSVIEPGLFWVQQGNDKVLVYATAEQARLVRAGSTVKVRGVVPKDWMRLAANELNASAVQTVR